MGRGSNSRRYTVVLLSGPRLEVGVVCRGDLLALPRSHPLPSLLPRLGMTTCVCVCVCDYVLSTSPNASIACVCFSVCVCISLTGASILERPCMLLSFLFLCLLTGEIAASQPATLACFLSVSSTTSVLYIAAASSLLHATLSQHSPKILCRCSFSPFRTELPHSNSATSFPAQFGLATGPGNKVAGLLQSRC